MATKKTAKTTTVKAAAPKAAPAKKAATPKAAKKPAAKAPETEDLPLDVPEKPAAKAPAKKTPAKAPAAKKPAAPKATRVTFRVRAEVGSKVFLAGSFNDWNPTAKAMADKDGTGEFTCTLSLPKGRYEYKFVSGTT